MNFINYRSSFQDIETVEDLRGMSKAEKQSLLAEYKAVSPRYYASNKATKEYYASLSSHEVRGWTITRVSETSLEITNGDYIDNAIINEQSQVLYDNSYRIPKMVRQWVNNNGASLSIQGDK